MINVVQNRQALYRVNKSHKSTHLHKHLWISTELCHRRRCAVATHGLAVSWKLECKVLVPQAVDGIHAGSAKLLATQLATVDRRNVHLLWQHDQRRLRSLANLFVCTFLLPDNIDVMTLTSRLHSYLLTVCRPTTYRYIISCKYNQWIAQSAKKFQNISSLLHLRGNTFYDVQDILKSL